MSTSQQPSYLPSPVLLMLIDVLLSPSDEIRINQVVTEMAGWLHTKNIAIAVPMSVTLPPRRGSVNPQPFCFLDHLVALFLSLFPAEAARSSDHDGSLPLHFAASLGDVPLAHLIYSKVGDWT